MQSFMIFTHNGNWLPSVYPSDINESWFLSDHYYPVYYNVFTTLIPSLNSPYIRMFEFGVRSGYIPIVFKRALDMLNLQGEYKGIDLNNVFPKGLEMCHESLDILNLKHELVQADVKSYDFSKEQGYHIIHVDSEHTFEGKLSDLNNAKKMICDDGYILIDDVDFGHVREPVTKFLQDNEGLFDELYVKTHQGLLILRSKRGR